MKRRLACAALICAGLGTVAYPVSFPDSNLEAAIEKALQMVDPSAVDMLDLFSLECDNCSISDITGLEYASNLISLSLTHNQISGLSPVAAPTHLTNLNMNSNNFSDLTALSGLMGLTGLNIYRNPISDISPLAPLINVQSLEIRLCDISDVSPPAGMTDLERLIINDNLIANPLLARPGLWLNAADPRPKAAGSTATTTRGSPPAAGIPKARRGRSIPSTVPP